MLTIHELYEDIIIGIDFYSSQLFSSVPIYISEGLLSVLCFGVVALILWKGKRAFNYIAHLILTEYLILLYCATIFFRTPKDYPEYHYTLFWSYDHSNFEVQYVMNVLVFIPIGFLIGCFGKYTWRKAILLGFFFSVSIELLQLILKSGFSELDDVMHNTLGCIIGYGLYSLMRVGYESFTKRNMGVLKTRKLE